MSCPTTADLFDNWKAEPVDLDLVESEPLERGARIDVYRAP